jgi:hypothetical protein
VVKLGTQSVIGALSFWILIHKNINYFFSYKKGNGYDTNKSVKSRKTPFFFNFNIILSLQIFIAHCLAQIALLARNLLSKLRIFEVSFIFQYLKGLPRAHSPKVHSKIKKPLPVALDW